MENNGTKKSILWITRTAIFAALLVVAQGATAGLGNTLITGVIVNLILVLAVMTSGLPVGAAVALISPVLAKAVGIGPAWGIVPFIMLGNLSLVVVWHIIGGKLKTNPVAKYAIAAVVGAVVKFLVLLVGVVKIAVPLLLKLPEPQASKISAMFSVPQLITALIGGGVAVVVLPLLLKALGKSKN